MCVYNTFAGINISCQVVIDGCFWMSGQNKCVAAAECLLPNSTSFGWNGLDFWSFNTWFTVSRHKASTLNLRHFSHLHILLYCIFLGHAQGEELAYSYLLKEYWLVYSRSTHAANSLKSMNITDNKKSENHLTIKIEVTHVVGSWPFAQSQVWMKW